MNHPGFHFQCLHFLLQTVDFAQHPTDLLLLRQEITDFFPFCQFLCHLIAQLPGFHDPGRIGLGRAISKMVFMVFQISDPFFRFLQPLTELLRLFFQCFYFSVSSFRLAPLRFQLRKQAAAMIAAAVFQRLQFFHQALACTAFIAGGHQRVQPPPQILIIGQRQIIEPNESGP